MEMDRIDTIVMISLATIIFLCLLGLVVLVRFFPSPKKNQPGAGKAVPSEIASVPLASSSRPLADEETIVSEEVRRSLQKEVRQHTLFRAV